jgi:hypothetical protein
LLDSGTWQSPTARALILSHPDFTVGCGYPAFRIVPDYRINPLSEIRGLSPPVRNSPCAPAQQGHLVPKIVFNFVRL